MKVLPYGTRALLAEVADHRHGLALYDDLVGTPLDGMVDVVPAARTVLVVFADERRAGSAAPALAARSAVPRPRDEGPVVEIPVVYDGADLGEVADLASLPVDEIVARHLTGDYVVAFVGFAPGFAYLAGLDAALQVARRQEPRTNVPAGSVALAGEYTAVYPGESPGGWRLIGRTTTRMWGLDRDPPSLLRPGSRVRFVRADR
jgi:KipI family sensor histidine kinase inhibitor